MVIPMDRNGTAYKTGPRTERGTATANRGDYHKRHQLPQFIVVGGRIRVARYGCGHGRALKEVCRQEGSIRAVRSVTLRADGQLRVIACVPWGLVGEGGE